MDNLPELKDIHLPDGISLFPPAYGWWVIVASILLLVIMYEVIRRLRMRSKKLYALRLLDNVNANNAVESAREISEILRRICIVKYPAAAVLLGRNWVDFLNSHCKKNLAAKTAQFLIDAPYMPLKSTIYSNEDVESLKNFCREWIGENL